MSNCKVNKGVSRPKKDRPTKIAWNQLTSLHKLVKHGN